jgi:hypothetical protein
MEIHLFMMLWFVWLRNGVYVIEMTVKVTGSVDGPQQQCVTLRLEMRKNFRKYWQISKKENLIFN